MENIFTGGEIRTTMSSLPKNINKIIYRVFRDVCKNFRTLFLGSTQNKSPLRMIGSKIFRLRNLGDATGNQSFLVSRA